jgi:hypothetical protein
MNQITILQWVGGVISWFFGGILLDVFKSVLAGFGNFLSGSVETLKDTSQTVRTNVVKPGAGKIEVKVIKDISRVLGEVKCSMLSWSVNLLSQVVELEEHKTKDVASEHPSPAKKRQNISKETYLVPCENNVTSVFSKSPENKYAAQQIIGALIGSLALSLFVYADAAQGAQTYSLLFTSATVPPFLNDIILPLVTASVGSALILGLFIGDILGMTHLGLYEPLKQKGDSRGTPQVFLWIICCDAAFSLLLSTLIALERKNLLDPSIVGVNSLVNFAQSIVIFPMLLTTILLFRGLKGYYVVLSIILSLLAIPFGVFEFFIRILYDLVHYGIIAGDFIIRRIIWLASGAFELFFGLLGFVVMASFFMLMYSFIGVFFIPKLLISILLKATKREDVFESISRSILSNELQTEINKKPLIPEDQLGDNKGNN